MGGKKEQKKGGFAPREGLTAKLECNFARLRKLAPFSLTHFTAAPFFRQRCISPAVAVRTTIIAFFTESPINNLVWEASPLLFPLNSFPSLSLTHTQSISPSVQVCGVHPTERERVHGGFSRLPLSPSSFLRPRPMISLRRTYGDVLLSIRVVRL